jgi:hypothetical protein
LSFLMDTSKCKRTAKGATRCCKEEGVKEEEPGSENLSINSLRC